MDLRNRYAVATKVDRGMTMVVGSFCRSGSATHANVTGFDCFLDVPIDTWPPHQTATYSFHAYDPRVCTVKSFQQCFVVDTCNDHSCESCPPHETAIMAADFISSLGYSVYVYSPTNVSKIAQRFPIGLKIKPKSVFL